MNVVSEVGGGRTAISSKRIIAPILLIAFCLSAATSCRLFEPAFWTAGLFRA
jgi:hypothetical protein